MIPVVAPPLEAPFSSDDDQHRLEPIKASANGPINAFRLVTHERATWREALIGSAFLLGAATAGSSVAGAVVAVRRRRRTRG
jgi:hypothetical protein